MTQLPNQDDLEEIVTEVAESFYGNVVHRPSRMGQAIRDLSDYYISDAVTRGICPDSTSHRAARLLFFTMADMPKSYFAIRECESLTGAAEQSSLRILDVGSGYGAQSLGLLTYLSERSSSMSIHLDLVDRDRQAHKALSAVLTTIRAAGIHSNLTWDTLRRDLQKPLKLHDTYDFIVIGNTLCELPLAAHRPTILSLLSTLKDTGALLAIEPALKKTTRELHALRDGLLEAQQCRVIAPCTHSRACPCLEAKSDWCHESRRIVLPPRCRKLAEATKLRRSNLKWSYLCLTRPDGLRKTNLNDTWRVVSEPMKQKGRHEVFLCGESGRYRAVLPDKEKSAENVALRDLDRGHLTQIHQAEIVRERLKLNKVSTVRFEDPALD